MLNNSKPPFNNINARFAVVYATNADELNRVHEANVNKLATQPYAPETLGYQADPGWPGLLRGKRSIVLDLHSGDASASEDRAALHGLLRQADVLVTTMLSWARSRHP